MFHMVLTFYYPSTNVVRYPTTVRPTRSVNVHIQATLVKPANASTVNVKITAGWTTA